MVTADLTLVIETSNPGSGSAGEVGLARGGGMIGTHGLRPEGRHDDALMPTIELLFEEARVTAAEIGCVAVSAGPGGYSSVRIAVSAAKMIALATGARCIGVPSCCVAACGSGLDGVRAVAMAGKRDFAWVRVYRVEDGAAVAVSDGESMDAAGLADLHERTPFDGVIADSFLPSSMRDWAEGTGLAVTPPVMSAAACFAASAGRESVAGAELVPVYPREPEAVRKWRELHG